MREQLFHLATDGATGLQARVREMLVGVILDGQIAPGQPLPGCRQLARQLGVARNTVVAAYQQLVDQGYLVARERSGYYVSATMLSGRVERRPPPPSSAGTGPDWASRCVITPSRQRYNDRPRDWRQYPYPFIYGQPDPALFPLADWRECERQALGVRAVRDWLLDRIDGDDPLLIEQIQRRVLPRRGVYARPEEILITLGAQQALYLLARLLLKPTLTMGLENPGYADARNIFALHTPRLRGLPLDGEGLIIGPELDGCDYVYVTPSHQYPTTVTLPLARREALLARAAADDFVVIEDDYESENNYSGEPTPALKSLDRSGRVLYVGSLSKTLGPSLRLGYLVAPEPLIREARVLRRLLLRHPPANNQRTAALFLKLGHYDALVKRLRQTYHDRWQALGAALATHLPQATLTPTRGGTSYWLRGPETLDARQLAAEADRLGVLFAPGDVFFLNEPLPQHYFRLGFAALPVEQIEPGVQRLAAAWQACGLNH